MESVAVNISFRALWRVMEDTPLWSCFCLNVGLYDGLDHGSDVKS